MPLKLSPPREGKTPYYYIRGTYLGKRVFQSSQTADRAVAQRELNRIKKEIEGGRFSDRKGPTFADAVAAYLLNGGSKRFLTRLLKHFKEIPLEAIDQDAITKAAEELYPKAPPSTINRQVHTPVSAVLKYAGIDHRLTRPKGHDAKRRVQWLKDEVEAGKLFEEATKVDRELATLLILLVYTGMRLGEALGLDIQDLDLDRACLYVPDTKNGEPRMVHLPPYVVTTLRAHPRGLEREGRVFRFTKGQRLYQALAKATKAAKVPWFTFHYARHTWATWMTRYGNLDSRGIVGTGAWKDAKSVARYAHVVTTEEAQKADLLPVPKARRVG